jgi:hypothetical protein
MTSDRVRNSSRSASTVWRFLCCAGCAEYYCGRQKPKSARRIGALLSICLSASCSPCSLCDLPSPIEKVNQITKVIFWLFFGGNPALCRAEVFSRYLPRPNTTLFVVTGPSVHNAMPILVPDRSIFIVKAGRAFSYGRERGCRLKRNIPRNIKSHGLLCKVLA